MKAMMRTACAAAAALVTAGCAGGAAGAGMAGDGEGEFLRVMVENDGTIPAHVRVFLIPSGGGAETLVGTMGTLGTETLTTTLPRIQGSYRLRAEGTGYTLTSPPVSLRGNETIRWDMRNNIVRLGSR